MSQVATRNHTPIAIEVQADQLVAVQRMRHKGQWKTSVNISVARVPDAAGANAHKLSDAELDVLERSLSRQGAVGRAMVLMSPAVSTCVELLELPPRTAQMPIDQLARAEMARLARWDDSTPFRVMTWDVPPPLRRANADAAATTSLYAAAVEESSVSPLIAQLWSRGWSVQAVIPAPLVAASLSEATVGGGIVVVVDLRATHAALTLVRDGVPIYHRDLHDNGVGLLLRGIVAEVGISLENAAAALDAGSIELHRSGARARSVCEGFAEALASELEASLAFAARRYGDVNLTRLALVGIGARIVGLAEWLCSRLEIPEEPVSSLAIDPVIAPCVALAHADLTLKGDAGLLPTVQRELVQREKIARLWLTAAAMIAVSAGVGIAALYAMNAAPTQVQEAQLAGHEHEEARTDTSLVEANRALADLRMQMKFEDRLAAQPDYSAVFRLLGSTLDGSTVLRDIALTDAVNTRPITPASPAALTAATPLRRIKLTGTAPAAAVLTSQVAALRALDVFSNVELARTSRSVSGAGVSFELTMDLVAPATASATPKGAK